MSNPNLLRIRERLKHGIVIAALGATALASMFGAGFLTGRRTNENLRNTPAHTAYAYSTAELDNSYGGFAKRTIQIDPNNANNQFYFAAYNQADGKAASVAYISIDGGKSWAYVDRPAANGINKDASTVVIGGSFAPGTDNNVALHEPGEEFEITFLSQDGGQVSTELAIANRQGITPVDVESVTGVTPANNAGAWTADNRGSYIFRLPLMDQQGNAVKPLVVSEPLDSK